MEATTKLQKAGRAFLLRLVAEYGPRGAARVVRALADELSRLPKSAGYQARPGAASHSDVQKEIVSLMLTQTAFQASAAQRTR
jgi:hypothetical protein